MNKAPGRIIELTEQTSQIFPFHTLSFEEGSLIYNLYDKDVGKLNIEFPTPKTDNKWKLTAQGWVRHIPVNSDLVIILNPKVSLSNLFRALEYAYRLPKQSFCFFLKNWTLCESLNDFYGSLAKYLSFLILLRGKRGFYSAYEKKQEELSCIRGKIDIRKAATAPWKIKFDCEYQENTIDNFDNQILVWTLNCIARNPLCNDEILHTVKKAYRTLAGSVSITKLFPCEFSHHLYNRLNQDYQQYHAICRFFLENSGPSHKIGSHNMLPFLIEMPRLYQLFVSEWLKEHLPKGITLKSLERISTGKEGVRFEIDLVLYNQKGKTLCVLDTKYKKEWNQSDINQIRTYAGVKQCNYAVLIYPESPSRQLNTFIGRVKVQSLTFSLDGDFEKTGEIFLNELLYNISLE